MGKLVQGINGPFIGKIGPAVGYLWKRIPCVRAYQKEVRYPNTVGQQHERDWFIAMVRFAAQARQALILGVKKHADAASMTEGNYFVTKNKQHFQYSNNGVVVDYARLSLATGPAAEVVFHDAVFREHEVISIDFDKNTLFSRAAADDKVYVYAYSPELGKGQLTAPAERRAKNITFSLPNSWSGTTVHLYGFVVDRDGRPSNSTYIGAGRLDHYSEGGNYIPLNKSWMDFVEVANRINASDSAASPVDNAEPALPESATASAAGTSTPPGLPDAPE